MLIQPADDALWSVMNPLDALTGKGRAANQAMAYPVFGRFGARTPGLRAETLQVGDPRVSFDGWETTVSRGEAMPNTRFYNLRNEKDEIVASADREMHRPIFAGRESRTAHVPEMWVRPDYRNSTAMFDLYRLLTHGGKYPVTANFANKDLAHVFERRMAREQGLPDPGSRVNRRRNAKNQQQAQERSWEEAEIANRQAEDAAEAARLERADSGIQRVLNAERQAMAERSIERTRARNNVSPTFRRDTTAGGVRFAETQRAGRAQETKSLREAVNPVQSLNMNAARQLQLALAMERSGAIARRRRRPAPVADAFLPAALRVGRPTGTRGGR
jgi:hypothetical protein